MSLSDFCLKTIFVPGCTYAQPYDILFTIRDIAKKVAAYGNFGFYRRTPGFTIMAVIGGGFGHECINELIVSRLMSVLQIPHLEYQIIHALVLLDGKA